MQRHPRLRALQRLEDTNAGYIEDESDDDVSRFEAGLCISIEESFSHDGKRCVLIDELLGASVLPLSTITREGIAAVDVMMREKR